MRVIFCIPGPLRPFSSGRDEVEVDTPSPRLREALEALWIAYPGLRDRVVNEQGEVREHVNLFVGNEDIRHSGRLATPLADGAKISIVPAISGG